MLRPECIEGRHVRVWQILEYLFALGSVSSDVECNKLVPLSVAVESWHWPDSATGNGLVTARTWWPHQNWHLTEREEAVGFVAIHGLRLSGRKSCYKPLTDPGGTSNECVVYVLRMWIALSLMLSLCLTPFCFRMAMHWHKSADRLRHTLTYSGRGEGCFRLHFLLAPEEGSFQRFLSL